MATNNEPWRIWGERTTKAYDSEHGLMSEEEIMRDDLRTFGWRVSVDGTWSHHLLTSIAPMKLHDAYEFATAND